MYGEDDGTETNCGINNGETFSTTLLLSIPVDANVVVLSILVLLLLFAPVVQEIDPTAEDDDDADDDDDDDDDVDAIAVVRIEFVGDTEERGVRTDDVNND